MSYLNPIPDNPSFPNEYGINQSSISINCCAPDASPTPTPMSTPVSTPIATSTPRPTPLPNQIDCDPNTESFVTCVSAEKLINTYISSPFQFETNPPYFIKVGTFTTKTFLGGEKVKINARGCVYGPNLIASNPNGIAGEQIGNQFNFNFDYFPLIGTFMPSFFGIAKDPFDTALLEYLTTMPTIYYIGMGGNMFVPNIIKNNVTNKNLNLYVGIYVPDFININQVRGHYCVDINRIL